MPLVLSRYNPTYRPFYGHYTGQPAYVSRRLRLRTRVCRIFVGASFIVLLLACPSCLVITTDIVTNFDGVFCQQTCINASVFRYGQFLLAKLHCCHPHWRQHQMAHKDNVCNIGISYKLKCSLVTRNSGASGQTQQRQCLLMPWAGGENDRKPGRYRPIVFGFFTYLLALGLQWRS